MSGFIQTLIDSVIKMIFKNGIPVNEVMQLILGSDVLTFTQFNIENFDGFFAFELTPKFDIKKKHALELVESLKALASEAVNDKSHKEAHREEDKKEEDNIMEVNIFKNIANYIREKIASRIYK